MIISTCYSIAQNNELTIDEFYSIEINGVLFPDIKNTNGNETLLINLLGNNNDGTQSVIYTKLSSDCCAFAIETDQSGFITKIEYFVWT